MNLKSQWPSNPRSLREWQLERLRGYLRTTVLPFSSHYGALFRRENIDPGQLRSADDDRRQRIEAARVDLARELARLYVEHGSEPSHELVPPLRRHIPHPELDGGSRDVRDDDAATAIEDRAARCLDPDQAELIRLRGVQVLVAREHLERPEAEEEDDECDEREPAEDRNPERELRREAVRPICFS